MISSLLVHSNGAMKFKNLTILGLRIEASIWFIWPDFLKGILYLLFLLSLLSAEFDSNQLLKNFSIQPGWSYSSHKGLSLKFAV